MLVYATNCSKPFNSTNFAAKTVLEKKLCHKLQYSFILITWHRVTQLFLWHIVSRLGCRFNSKIRSSIRFVFTCVVLFTMTQIYEICPQNRCIRQKRVFLFSYLLNAIKINGFSSEQFTFYANEYSLELMQKMTENAQNDRNKIHFEIHS